MRRALIGHTGSIGTTLRSARAWDACFNRENLLSLRGADFDLIVCAALPAARHRAEANPGGDRSNMMSLLGVLDTVRAKRFVLVSTFDVYPERLGVDEDSVVEPRGDSAFAEHRLEFESRIAARFFQCHIVRLPAVFGPGARRNAVHDLVNRVELESINPQSRFQWYPVERLAGDIDTVMALSLPRVNLATEPIATSDLHRAFFGDLAIGGRAAPAEHVDVHSRHGRAFGGDDRYMMTAAAVRASMGRWLAGVGRQA
jgi:hypothetical protein